MRLLCGSIIKTPVCRQEWWKDRQEADLRTVISIKWTVCIIANWSLNYTCSIAYVHIHHLIMIKAPWHHSLFLTFPEIFVIIRFEFLINFGISQIGRQTDKRPLSHRLLGGGNKLWQNTDCQERKAFNSALNISMSPWRSWGCGGEEA